MKTKTLILAILILNLISEIAFAQIMFQKTYGGSSLIYANSVRQTNDGGYIISGYKYGDLYLIKTNMNGDTLWTRSFEDAIGYSVEQTNDGGFITAGATGTNDLYLIRTDSIGDTLWTKAMGGISLDDGLSVKQTADGGYIIAGSTQSFGAGIRNIYLIKTNSIGDTLWTKAYGGTGLDQGNFVQQTTDGGYIITGYSSSFSPDLGLYLLKTDSFGNLLWSKIFNSIIDDVGKTVQQTNDGGYIIVGYASSITNADILLIKTNGNGNIVWTKTFGGANADLGYSVQQTNEGGYIISGETRSFGVADWDVYLIKTDNNGDTLWTRTFGGAAHDKGNSVQQTYDGGYLIAGTFSGNLYLIKTDSMGNSGCNQGTTSTITGSPILQVTIPATIVSSTNTVINSITGLVGSGGTVTTLCTTVGIQSQTTNPKSEISISPNPFHSSTTLTIDNNLFNDHLTLSIFSIDGRILRKQNLASHQTIIERKGMSNGLYFYKLAENGIVKSVGKLLIE